MNATGRVTGTRERYGTLPPAGRVIGSAAGAGGNLGISLSRQPTGSPVPAAVPAEPSADAAEPFVVVPERSAGSVTGTDAAADAFGGPTGDLAGRPHAPPIPASDT